METIEKEVAGHLKEVAGHLEALRHKWENSRRTDFSALLGALDFCRWGDRPLPDWVYAGVRALVEAELPKWPVAVRRHHFARAFLEVGVGWDESFRKASELLQGTPAEGGEHAVRRDYQAIERSLPPEQRRKRTWRRPRPPLR